MNGEKVSPIRSHKDLEVWELSMKLAEDCYLATKPFPREEAFGQTAQIRRAAVSIPANIAEGYGRETTGSFIQSLRVAQGSQKELETHILLCQRVGFLSVETATGLLGRIESVGRLLRNFIRSLEAKQSS